MAHNLDFTTGAAAFFGVKTPAWHQLGTIVQNALTAAEAIATARLNYAVEKQQLFLSDGTLADGAFATVRTDTTPAKVLGVVGSQYTPFQNAEAFDFMDSLVSDKLAMYETAGALDGGRTIWILARIPKTLRAAGDDVINPYVLLTNSHDGSRTLRMLPTSIRVVCQNTLNYALGVGRGAGLAIYHTGKLADRIATARKNLGIIIAATDLYQQEIDAMVRTALTPEETRAYFETLFPTSTSKARELAAFDAGRTADNGTVSAARGRKLETLINNDGAIEAAASATVKRNEKIQDQVKSNLANARNSLPGIRGTVWSAYNAVSEYADHDSRVQGKTTDARANNRLKSIWFGTANDIKQGAYAEALALVQ